VYTSALPLSCLCSSPRADERIERYRTAVTVAGGRAGIKATVNTTMDPLPVATAARNTCYGRRMRSAVPRRRGILTAALSCAQSGGRPGCEWPVVKQPQSPLLGCH
jgi:hypothetical protein